MSRPESSKSKQKIEKEIEKVEEVVRQKPTDVDKLRRLEEERAVIANLDTEKANKDMLLKSAKEIQQHIRDAKAELLRINQEVENGHRTVRHLQDEIKAQAYNLSRQSESFEKANQEKLRILETKMKEVEVSDTQYKKLLLEVNAQTKTISIQLQAISAERAKHQLELNRLNTHVSQVESEDSRIRADIKAREDKLKDAIEKFDAEKEALEPELKRISEIKNENLLLWQKIEDEKAQFDRQKSNMDNYKAKLDADDVLRQQQVKNELLKLQNNEARLRKWEEDLGDRALELKSREGEAAKALKRYQLTKSVEATQ